MSRSPQYPSAFDLDGGQYRDPSPGYSAGYYDGRKEGLARGQEILATERPKIRREATQDARRAIMLDLIAAGFVDAAEWVEKGGK